MKPKLNYTPFRNFGLLSFGEEAEGDEQETTIFVKQNAGKAKSLHDATDDPKLSKEPIKMPKTEPEPEPEQNDEHLSDDCEEETFAKTSINAEIVKSKLARSSKATSAKQPKYKDIKSESEDDDDDILMTQEQEQNQKKSKEKYVYRWCCLYYFKYILNLL